VRDPPSEGSGNESSVGCPETITTGGSIVSSWQGREK
jgi:hypothetical protein